MELIKYLNENFYTKQELLEVSKINESTLSTQQKQEVMPLSSYELSIEINSSSFFGVHKEKLEIEYYAKGYSSWIGIIQSISGENNAYNIFSQRYINTIERLKQEGHISNNAKVNANIESHIQEEWKYFLDGTYGLCTKSGLPEDIAAKELAILEINELTISKVLSEAELTKLTKAVNLLDSASSMFAPHERIKSSRHRLVDEIRRRYSL